MRTRPIKQNNSNTTAGIMETETERLTGENARLTAEIARLDAENSRLAHENDRVARSAEELAVVRAELVTMKREVSNVYRNKEKVEGELERVREEMVVTWGQAADLVLQKEELETRVILADKEFVVVKDEWKEMLDVLRVVRAERSELQLVNSRLAEELANAKGEFQALKAENEEQQTLNTHNAQDASNSLRYCAALEGTVAVLEEDINRARTDLTEVKEELQIAEEGNAQLKSENVRLTEELSSVKEELYLSKTGNLEQPGGNEISTEGNLSALIVEELRTAKTENTAVLLALDICSAEELAAAQSENQAMRKQTSEIETRLVSERRGKVMLEDEHTQITEGLPQIGWECCGSTEDTVRTLKEQLKSKGKKLEVIASQLAILRREHNRISSSNDDLKTVAEEKCKLEEENQRLCHKINRLLSLPP